MDKGGRVGGSSMPVVSFDCCSAPCRAVSVEDLSAPFAWLIPFRSVIADPTVYHVVGVLIEVRCGIPRRGRQLAVCLFLAIPAGCCDVYATPSRLWK